MRTIRQVAVLIQSLVILLLLSGFSSSVGQATPAGPTQTGCNYCESEFYGSYYAGSWGDECDTYEDPDCGACPG